MLKSRLDDAYKLIKAKCYILITDDDATIAGDFRGFEKLLAVQALQNMKAHVTGMIGKLSKEKPNGRNKSRRQSSGRRK